MQCTYPLPEVENLDKVQIPTITPSRQLGLGIFTKYRASFGAPSVGVANLKPTRTANTITCYMSTWYTSINGYLPINPAIVRLLAIIPRLALWSWTHVFCHSSAWLLKDSAHNNPCARWDFRPSVQSGGVSFSFNKEIICLSAYEITQDFILVGVP